VTWKTPVTLLVLLGVLLGAAYYGWASIVSDDSPDQKTSPTSQTCTTTKVTKGQRLTAKNVLINVYNAGSVEGLASRTLTTLKARGFRAGVAANAPSGVVTGSVMILTQDRTAPETQLVARQFRGPIGYAKPHDVAASGVSVVVGDNFAGFRKQTPRAIVVHRPTKACSTTSKS
jgi:hypothetical protein